MDVGSSSDELRTILERSRELGFLGPGPVGEQIAHSEAFASAVASRANPRDVLDLGSGGGVPGLVLLERWPDVTMTLLDSSSRREAFLRHAVELLGETARCSTVLGRAEELARTELRERFDLVVARSFGPPAVTAECATGFVAIGGWLVTAEPPDVTDRWDPGGLELLGFAAASRVAGPPAFAVMRKVAPCPDRFPRRTGIPAKRPLF